MEYHRVLVTGGAGFIGSHLTEALLARHREVVVYDNLSTGRRENLPADAKLIEADVRDLDRLRAAMHGADAVFHLAARVSIRDSIQHFAEDAEVNLLGTLRVLKACASTRPRKLILASSMAVYADSPRPDPVDESHPTEPISPYGISKLAAEKYCLQLCPQFGVEPVVLRLFNTYGPRQTDTPYVGVISIFIRRLLKGEAPTIFGSGEQSRDFVHVSDIVAANILALESEARGCILNAGTGVATSVNRVAALLCRKIAPDIEPEAAPAQPGELQNCIADVSAARRVLGYRPLVALADKIDDVIAYFRQTEC